MEYPSDESSKALPGFWNPGRVFLMAVIILSVGIFLGYLFSGSFSQRSPDSLSGGNNTAVSAFDSSIRPLLERLKSSPNDSDLLATIGNRYYDHRDYDKAVEYYERSLTLRPDNVDVRTDMGTAIWYGGDPDGAIREYEASLKFEPNHSQTLLNMGIVKWQGKRDGTAALELWQRLLRLNPNYPDRQKVDQLIQQVQAEMK